jgi:hypothetical protein
MALRIFGFKILSEIPGALDGLDLSLDLFWRQSKKGLPR